MHGIQFLMENLSLGICHVLKEEIVTKKINLSLRSEPLQI